MNHHSADVATIVRIAKRPIPSGTVGAHTERAEDRQLGHDRQQPGHPSPVHAGRRAPGGRRHTRRSERCNTVVNEDTKKIMDKSAAEGPLAARTSSKANTNASRSSTSASPSSPSRLVTEVMIDNRVRSGTNAATTMTSSRTKAFPTSATLRSRNSISSISSHARHRSSRSSQFRKRPLVRALRRHLDRFDLPGRQLLSKNAAAGCTAEGSSTSLYREPLEPVVGLAFRSGGPEVDVDRTIGVGFDRAGLAAEARQVLIRLQHRAGLTVIEDQGPEAALGDVRRQRHAIVATAVEVVALLSRMA